MFFMSKKSVKEDIMLDVLIIGAGVVGGMIARELSRYEISVAMVEKGAVSTFRVTLMLARSLLNISML